MKNVKIIIKPKPESRNCAVSRQLYVVFPQQIAVLVIF